MQHGTKLVLLPEPAYNNMIALKREETSPTVFRLVRCNEELQELLNNKSMPDDVKALRFQDLLFKYQDMKRDYQKTLRIEKPERTTLATQTQLSIPPPPRTAAQQTPATPVQVPPAKKKSNKAFI